MKILIIWPANIWLCSHVCLEPLIIPPMQCKRKYVTADLPLRLSKDGFPISTWGNQPILTSENNSDTQEKKTVICILFINEFVKFFKLVFVLWFWNFYLNKQTIPTTEGRADELSHKYPLPWNTGSWKPRAGGSKCGFSGVHCFQLAAATYCVLVRPFLCVPMNPDVSVWVQHSLHTKTPAGSDWDLV